MKIRKLSLTRETLSNLSESEIAKINGGTIVGTSLSGYLSRYFSCVGCSLEA